MVPAPARQRTLAGVTVGVPVGGSPCWLEGDLVSEGLELGDEPAGLAFGVQAAVEVVGAELVVGGAGGQDVPGDDEDGVGHDDDGLVLGGAAAVAAGFHDVPVVEGLEVALVPGRCPGGLGEDGLEVLVARQDLSTLRPGIPTRPGHNAYPKSQVGGYSRERV